MMASNDMIKLQIWGCLNLVIVRIDIASLGTLEHGNNANWNLLILGTLRISNINDEIEFFVADW